MPRRRRAAPSGRRSRRRTCGYPAGGSSCTPIAAGTPTMPGRILVVGSYLRGIAMQVEAFPAAGETVVAGGIGRGHGGKGSNQAIQAARCGAPVRLLSAVGLDEAGNHAARQWAADGIDSDLVERSAEEATGLGFILVNPRGENQIVIDPGATARCDALFVSRRREAFADVAIVLTQLEIPVTGAIAALEEGRPQGTAAGSLACTLHGVVPALHRRAEIAALARTLTEERLGS